MPHASRIPFRTSALVAAVALGLAPAAVFAQGAAPPPNPTGTVNPAVPGTNLAPPAVETAPSRPPVTLGDLPDGPDAYAPPSMGNPEYVSVACIVGAAVAGVATVLGGGIAIATTGGVGGPTGSAVAVPVLVATVAAGCGVAQSMAPGIWWLQRQGKGLVGSIERKIDAIPAPGWGGR